MAKQFRAKRFIRIKKEDGHVDHSHRSVCACPVFGLVALTAILKNKPTPKPAVFIHGGLAAVALLLVIFFVTGSAGPSPIASLVLFVVAALGGFALFAIDMQKKPVPKFLALAHPIIAAIALVLLIVFVLRG